MNVDDFDQQYPFIVINGADKTTKNTLDLTVGRIVGKKIGKAADQICSLIPKTVSDVITS